MDPYDLSPATILGKVVEKLQDYSCRRTILIAPWWPDIPWFWLPSTINGYRPAIADKLGNSPINISKDENLTCLLDSFHRDRSKGQRRIPSWNLLLVLQQLTKAPFEPIKEASLKHSTFKTVILLAFGSGKRRSEIQFWQNKIIKHQSD